VSVSIEERESFTYIRIADGVFIHEGVRQFMEKIKDLKAAGKIRFLVDFSKCDYISSEGMGAMSALWKYCTGHQNGKMAILFSNDPDNEVRYLFDVIGLSKIMGNGVFTDLAAAEKALS
jgi:anti-anti-sigma regulatory factor